MKQSGYQVIDSSKSYLPKRRFVAKSGSLVRFTPNFRKPASSPGVGL
jgi:hypothetical protein